jgi:hypothetical protein
MTASWRVFPFEEAEGNFRSPPIAKRIAEIETGTLPPLRTGRDTKALPWQGNLKIVASLEGP